MSYSPYVLPAERLEDPVTAEAILEYHGKTFHFASRLLGSRHRTRAARLYAFCRHADDLADNATDTDQARQALSALREDLVLDRPSTRQAADLLELSREIDLPMQAPIALIDGALKDLVDPIMQSERDLIRYAYHVAGSVGLMMCAALDVRDPRAWPHAIDLGIAMQLTNIARDVGERCRHGSTLPARRLDRARAAWRYPGPRSGAAGPSARRRCPPDRHQRTLLPERTAGTGLSAARRTLGYSGCRSSLSRNRASDRRQQSCHLGSADLRLPTAQGLENRPPAVGQAAVSRSTTENPRCVPAPASRPAVRC